MVVVDFRFLFCKHCFRNNNAVNDMQDTTPTKFSPLALRQMRQSQQLSLKQFWGAIGYSVSSGHSYETGKTDELPEHARRLIYLEYVAGIPTDIDSERFQQFVETMKLNGVQNITQVRKALESGIDAMQNTLAGLGHD